MTGSAPTPEELDLVSATPVFFGHQSVGSDVLAGLHTLWARSGRPAPPLTDALIGDNGDPLGKIDDFAARLRSGVADRVRVAMMKLCYADVLARTDVGGLFEAYRSTLARLERELPELTLMHVTVPVTTEPGPLARVRARLEPRRRDRDPGAPAANVQRERLNALLRREYAGRLFDLAAAESTRPDGTPVTGTLHGAPYAALFDGYAADAGHLNAVGVRTAAAAWVRAVARTVRDGRV